MSVAEQVAASTGLPSEKIVDIAVPSNVTPSDGVKRDAPEAPEGGKGTEPATSSEAAPAPVAEVPKVDKLERARRAVRERYQLQEGRRLAQVEAQRQTIEAQRYAQAAQYERQQREAAEAKWAEVSRDPLAAVAHLERAGLDPKTLTELALKANSPEGRLRAEIEAKVEGRLREMQEAHEAQLREIQQRESARQTQIAQSQARERFLTEAADAERFPAIAQLVERGAEWKSSLLEEAIRVLRGAHEKTGYEYTNDEVLSFLDKKYAQILPPKREGSTSKAGTEGSKESSPGTGAEAKTTAGGSRTLTNKDAQVKGSLPPDFDSLSDADQKKALAALLRQMSRG